MDTIDKTQFTQFVTEIKNQIRTAQLEALRAVNKHLVDLYWYLGKMIVERQELHGWGKSVVERLAVELKIEFPGTQGYSVQNLWYMRQFYLDYYQSEILQPLVGEISWAKNVVIMSKCKDQLQREFYLRVTKKFGWTKNLLIHHIENQSYEKYLLNQTSFNQTLPETLRDHAKLAVKDEYTFDFLGLGDEYLEYELEQGLMKNIRSFLIEMGGDFAFLGNQYVLEVGGREFRIDLLLFHRRLRCLVAVELKIGEFEPEHKGKMEFYLTALNQQVKLPAENDAIGIIICKSKNKTIVEYALKHSAHPIGVAAYALTSKLPADYAGLLPSVEEIQEHLGGLE